MDRECFICLEPNKVLNSRERTYYIQKYKYSFDCSCRTYTHEKCMQTWIEHTPICPICRHSLHIKKNYVVIILDISGRIIMAFVKSCITVLILFFGINYIFTAVKYEFDTRNCRM